MVIAAALALVAPVAVSGSAYAVSNGTQCTGTGNVAGLTAQGAGDASGGDVGCNPSGGINSDSAGNKVGDLAETIVNIFSVVVGAAAIIMIIYSGFRYITSGGSSERIGNAKTTLIYAIIGLVIVALSQILVRFVLSTAVGAGDNFQ